MRDDARKSSLSKNKSPMDRSKSPLNRSNRSKSPLDRSGLNVSGYSIDKSAKRAKAATINDRSPRPPSKARPSSSIS
jgi:hypothetical protein